MSGAFEILKKNLHGSVARNVLLKNYAYYQIGGPADIFVEPADDADLELVLQTCHDTKLPLTVIGAGTNLLVRDGGVRGATLFLGAGLPGDIKILSEKEDFVRVRVPAHWPKARLLDVALDNSWSGLEFSAGIPGTLGGAVWMNAGTKWGHYGEVIEKVRLFNITNGFREKTNKEMGFKYRGIGEGLLDAQTIIVSVDIKLSKKKSALESRALVDEILCYRGSKQPLELPNCGSVFKNPPNSEKGAGRLIEAAGLKGFCIGDAMISTKHANFILNLGKASSKDVEALISRCQYEVKKQFGIDLEPEVIVIGEKI